MSNLWDWWQQREYQRMNRWQPNWKEEVIDIIGMCILALLLWAITIVVLL